MPCRTELKGAGFLEVVFSAAKWNRCLQLPDTRSCWLLGMLLVVPLLFGCGVGVQSAADSPAQQAASQSTTGVLPASFFGMSVETSGMQPEVPSGARRLWDPSVSWAALEPARDSFRWDALDEEVTQARAAGVRITLVLAMTPTWASSQPAVPSAFGSGATAMPADLTAWTGFVHAVVTRYQGQIAAYEVWDAPENAAEWDGSAATLGSEMTALAQGAAAAIRQTDPSAQVVAPVLSADGLAGFLAAGGGSSVDVLAASLDTPATAPEGMVSELRALRAAAATGGAASKPFWNEQTAWVLPPASSNGGTAADLLARALLLNAGFGVEQLDWFAWDETVAGTLLLSDSTGEPTAAALAWSTVDGWLEGAQINGCAASAGGLWTCGLVRDGDTEWVLWSSEGTVQTSALGMSTAIDIAGNQNVVGAAGMVTVGSSPLLLR